MRSPPVARALGLVDLSTPAARAAVCASCHARSTRATPFDPTAPVHAIASPRAP
jgi:cytochrome c553